ncbi:MAG: hypothetical protein ACO2ZM_09590, partial [Francisellaceae bacterium]
WKIFRHEKKEVILRAFLNKRKYNLTFTKPSGSAASIMLPHIYAGYIKYNNETLFDLINNFWQNYLKTLSGNILQLKCIKRVAPENQYIRVPAQDGNDFIALIVVYCSLTPDVLKTHFTKIQSAWRNYLLENITSQEHVL